MIRKTLLLAVLSMVITSAPCFGFDSFSIHEKLYEEGETVVITGAVSSVEPVGYLDIKVNNEPVKADLYIGSVSESNLNGKWQVKVPKCEFYIVTAVTQNSAISMVCN